MNEQTLFKVEPTPPPKHRSLTLLEMAAARLDANGNPLATITLFSADYKRCRKLLGVGRDQTGCFMYGKHTVFNGGPKFRRG